VYRESRAFLETDLPAADYYSHTVRKKKRKELARLRNRLIEMGSLTTRIFKPGDDLAAWCDSFLELERSGWKGQGRQRARLQSGDRTLLPRCFGGRRRRPDGCSCWR
jgi:hypothetical protein